MIGGGFQRGSLTLVAGRPGTGKTVFASQFLHHGAAQHDESGIYVSFAEGRETYYKNMHGLGFDFKRLEKEGRFRFLDMVTVKEEGVAPILEMVLREIQALKAKRLVIDSFSAMSQAFKERIEARVVLHLILNRMVRQEGCTTLLIVEIPMGEERVGLGIEEFVADAVLILRRRRFDERDLREIEIAKLRGTELRQSRYIFTLHSDGRGVSIFPPFHAKQIEKPRIFQPIQDSETHFSTGNPELDKILGGGYRRGSYVLLDVGESVPYAAYRMLIRPTVLNFLANGRGVTYFPSAGVNPEEIREELSRSIDENTVNRLCIFYVKKNLNINRSKLYFVEYEGKSLDEDGAIRDMARRKLEEATGKPVLGVWGLDDYEATYGSQVGVIWSRYVAESALLGRLNLSVCKPAVKNPQTFKDLSTYHFKLRLIDGAVVVYLAKPASSAYCLEDDTSKGYHLARFTPMT